MLLANSSVSAMRSSKHSFGLEIRRQVHSARIRRANLRIVPDALFHDSSPIHGQAALRRPFSPDSRPLSCPHIMLRSGAFRDRMKAEHFSYLLAALDNLEVIGRV